MLWIQDRQAMLQKVDDYIRARFVYQDEHIETLQTPDFMLSGLEVNHYVTGDCDDIATLHAAILTCLDYRVRFVAIRSIKQDPNYDHVFIEAYQKNGWIPFDVTVSHETLSGMEYFGKVEITI